VPQGALELKPFGVSDEVDADADDEVLTNRDGHQAS
jgi:hypothetical protein